VPPIPRRAARVLLVDDSGRLLLFRGFDPDRPAHRYWFTAGGGLDQDEEMASGAVRELYEETGLRVTTAELGAAVWTNVTEFPFGGVRYRQEQEFFLVRVPAWTVVTDGFCEAERNSIDGHRWWTIEELETTAEPFYPAELVDLMRRLLPPAPRTAPDSAKDQTAQECAEDQTAQERAEELPC
jgi:8-oxo-dGTP pyrophosphatase MutT (NUDIX family)